MIKNDNQLAAAHKKLQELQVLVRDANDRYSGLELELMKLGIEEQIQDIQDDIEEYHELKELSFEQAVNLKLRQPILIEHIGELLAKLRLSAGLTQAQLAERLNWHQANVSRFEGENYTAQTLYKIIEYSSALGVWLHIFPSLLNETQSAHWYKSEEHRQSKWTFPEDTTSDDKPISDFTEDTSPYGPSSWFTEVTEQTSLVEHGELETAI